MKKSSLIKTWICAIIIVVIAVVFSLNKREDHVPGKVVFTVQKGNLPIVQDVQVRSFDENRAEPWTIMVKDSPITDQEDSLELVWVLSKILLMGVCLFFIVFSIIILLKMIKKENSFINLYRK